MHKTERTIIHLELKSDKLIKRENRTHFYFGSLAAIYVRFNSNDLGIAYGSLRNTKLSNTHIYENKNCIIRKDILETIKKKGED